MATLSGGQYITFAKPYIKMVADAIRAKKKIKIDKAGEVIVSQSKDIKAFLRAVDSKQDAQVKISLMTGSQYKAIFEGFKWTQIDKSQFSGMGGAKKSDGATTAMQERASMLAIQRSIEKNGYRDRKQFFKENRDDLIKLYPDMDEEWEETFFQQQITVQREVGNTRYGHYSRDDGFMDWITKFVKDKYDIVKKDSWNPADIWLVADYTKAKKILTDKIIDDVTPIQEFNAILRDMFHSRQIVGISLKKMSGKVALWELVNLDDADLFDNDEYTFDLEGATCNCSLKGKDEFQTSDARINMKSKKQSITFQIRQNSAGFNNLKIEGTDIGATSARLGKVPLPMAKNVYKAYKLSFDNDNRNFPKSADEFEKEYDQWSKIYKNIKEYTNVKSEDEWKSNMIAVFNSSRPDYAHSKLMQMKLFESTFSLKGKKLNSLLTELAFLAQKKGSVFGPFAKLY